MTNASPAQAAARKSDIGCPPHFDFGEFPAFSVFPPVVFAADAARCIAQRLARSNFRN
jgi:hypothetical protein